MFRSVDAILVTRNGKPAGFYIPWDQHAVPVELKPELFIQFREAVRSARQRASRKARSSSTLPGSLLSADVTDANLLRQAANEAGRDIMRPVVGPTGAEKVSVETNAQINDNGDLPALVVPALRDAFGDRLRLVGLFGSRAHGDHHAESDWDLLVIAERLPTRLLERYRVVKTALPPGTRDVVAVLAATPEEFEGHLPEIYLDIALDGQILWDRTGYAAGRLAELRRIMDRSGLSVSAPQRETSGNGSSLPASPGRLSGSGRPWRPRRTPATGYGWGRDSSLRPRKM